MILYVIYGAALSLCSMLGRYRLEQKFLDDKVINGYRAIVHQGLLKHRHLLSVASAEFVKVSSDFESSTDYTETDFKDDDSGSECENDLTGDESSCSDGDL